MAVYQIATNSKGERVWWAGYDLPGGLPGSSQQRDATEEEAALMEKVIWNRDSFGDLERLRELLNS